MARAGNEAPTAVHAAPAGKISHVIVIVQENRSVDNLFQGYPGVNTVNYGYGHGKKYVLAPVGLEGKLDIPHSRVQFLIDYDLGKGDGWDKEISGYKPGCANPEDHPQCWLYFSNRSSLAFSYVPSSETGPYRAMAKQFALADETFASNNGPSYVAHQYLIAGQSGHVSENPDRTPWGCDAPPLTASLQLRYGSMQPPYPKAFGYEWPIAPVCFQYSTAADLFDKANVSWAYYAPHIGEFGGIWSAFDAIWNVRFGRDWNDDVISPETTILNDIAAQKLRQVSWVVPAFINSDHAGSGSATGPDWVAAIVNAVGQSSYWNSTAIVVVWDEWGGWFDHVPPKELPDPQTGAYEGLGYRVPLLMISPYSKAGYVSHLPHELASTLHFIEKTFGLPSLGGADKRADDLGDMLDLAQPPLPFHPIPAIRPASFFLHQHHDRTPPDD